MRHHFKRLLLCLVLGVLTTVVAAWAPVIRESRMALVNVLHEAERREIERRELGRLPAYQGLGRRLPDVPSKPLGDMGTRTILFTHFGADRGWPLPALSTLRPSDSATQPLWSVSWAAGWRIPNPFHVPGPEPWFDCPATVELPIRPLWLGFVLDTACFACVWTALLYAIPLARRTLRRRRGLCPRCGYSLSGLAADSPCPECGGKPEPAR